MFPRERLIPPGKSIALAIYIAPLYTLVHIAKCMMYIFSFIFHHVGSLQFFNLDNSRHAAYLHVVDASLLSADDSYFQVFYILPRAAIFGERVTASKSGVFVRKAFFSDEAHHCHINALDLLNASTIDHINSYCIRITTS